MINEILSRLANTNDYEEQWKLLQAKALIQANGDKAVARKMLEVHRARKEMGFPLVVDLKESDFDIAFEIEFSPIGMDNLSRALQAAQDRSDVKLFRFCLDNNLLGSTKSYCFPFLSISWHLFMLSKKYYERTMSWPDVKTFTAWVKSSNGDEYLRRHSLGLTEILEGFTVSYDSEWPWRKLWLSWQFSGKVLELVRERRMTPQLEAKIYPLVLKLKTNQINIQESDIQLITEVLRA